jgi:NTE family protein
MPLDPQTRAEGLYFLRRNPLFGPMGEEVLSELVEKLQHSRLDKDAFLLHEGDLGEGLYLIKSGRVRIVSHERGMEKTATYLGRGEAIGELTLLTGEPHGYSVRADTPCEFLVLHKADFDAILEAHPIVAIHLSRALSHRLALSFHLPEHRPHTHTFYSLIQALPHEAMLIFIANLSIALVEQTRRKVLLLDLSPRSGDIARSLGLQPVIAPEIQEEDLTDFPSIRRMTLTHPSGLETLSLPPKILKNSSFNSIPPFFELLKDNYDFVLAIPPVEVDELSQVVLQEADKAVIVTWDKAPELTEPVRQAFQTNLADKTDLPVMEVHLHDPAVPAAVRADFRIPWSEDFHQPFRESGSPFLEQNQARDAFTALSRLARALGKLRVGLAMGSGAAYGYSLIGLLKVFEREHIPIDLAAGTSMGALLGSFFCAGKSPLEIEKISKTITKKWLFENILGDLTVPHSGLMAGQTLSGFLQSILGPIEFHQLSIPFAVIATDIRTGDEVVIKEGRVADAVRASTSLPILFKPVDYKGRYLVDGGLVNPVPTSTIANMGADILISVNLTAKPSLRRGMKRKQSFSLVPQSPGMREILFKMIYTMQYEIAQARTEIAHVVIAPDARDFTWTEFHRAEEIIKVGEAAAEEAVSKIKSLLPFFSDHCKVKLDKAV